MLRLLELLGHLWERAEPALGVLLVIVQVIVRVVTFLFRKPGVPPLNGWRSRCGSMRGDPFSTAQRANPKAWSVNDIPRQAIRGASRASGLGRQ